MEEPNVSLKRAEAFFNDRQFSRSNEICEYLRHKGYESLPVLRIQFKSLIALNQLADAKLVCSKSLDLFPEDKQAWLGLAHIHNSLKEYDEALAAYDRVLLIDPECSSAHNGMAVVYSRNSDQESALLSLKKAVSANPSDPVSTRNLARLLEKSGHLNSALEYYRTSLQLSPTEKNYVSMVSICKKLNFQELATTTCQNGLKIFPNSITLQRFQVELEECVVHITAEADQYVNNTIEAIHIILSEGKLKLTEEKYESLYKDYPYHPAVLYHYGIFCLQYLPRQKTNKGLKMLNRIILTYPHFMPAYSVLGRYFFSKNNFKKAIQIAREGLKFDKGCLDLYHMIGMAFEKIGSLKDAILTLNQGLENTKESADKKIPLYLDLGNFYTIDGEFSTAKDCYEKILKEEPTHQAARFNYALLLTKAGVTDRSIEMFKSLSNLDQNGFEAFLYACAGHPHEYRKIPKYLENWSERYANYIKPNFIQYKKHDRKKIRVGYVSSDFRNHPVAFFMAGAYSRHNKKKFEIYSYYNGFAIDDYTHHFQEHSDLWRDVRELADQELIERIAMDEIDILVDLSGHTTNNRLAVFVGKPAPIQVTYLGYFATTGIHQIDYRIIDSYATYATPDICTEKLIELPNCYLCYQPFRLNVPTSSHAQSTNGAVTFGSFHRLSKIHPQLINIWSEILNRVPNSSLLMKTRYLDASEIQSNLLAQFTENGVKDNQINFDGYARSYVEHLSRYDDIDIMLDAFPYNGTTITCESLWMGVPVVTLAGDRHLSRIGLSINTNAGLSELVGENESDYIRIATELARDKKRLYEYNKTLRDHFLASKVCDAKEFTKNIEIVYQKIYQKWLENN